MRRFLHRRRAPWALMLLSLAAACSSPPGGSDGGTDAGTDGGTPGAVCTELPATSRGGAGPTGVLASPRFTAAWGGFVPGSLTTNTVQVGGRTVHVLHFQVETFAASASLGPAWVQPVVVVAPDPADPKLVTDLVLSSARSAVGNGEAPGAADPTWGTSPPSWWHGTDNETDFLETYGGIAVSAGIPFVAGEIVPEAGPGLASQGIDLPDTVAAQIHQGLAANEDDCDDALCDGTNAADPGVLTSEGAINQCLGYAAEVTGDPSYWPYLQFAVSQQRILEASQQVLNGYYQGLGSATRFDWTRRVTVGCSKRGITQFDLAAIDPHVVAAFAYCANAANLPMFEKQRATIWTGGWKIQPPPPMGGVATSAPVNAMLEGDFDPFRWAPPVLAGRELVVGMGTRDSYFNMGFSLDYFAALPTGSRLLLVPGYGHGMGTVDHAGAVRAYLRSVTGAAPWPSVTARWNTATDTIDATVSGGQAQGAELWCDDGLLANPDVYDVSLAGSPPSCRSVPLPPSDGPDTRQTSWVRLPLRDLGNGRYRAAGVLAAIAAKSASGKAPADPACFVRIVSADGSPATSGPLLSKPLCRALGLPFQ